MKNNKFIQWALYALIAVIMPLGFTACSDDDDDDNDQTPGVITVNVAPMYEELGIDGLVKNLMAEDNNYRVKVTVLVYDKDGDLVNHYDEYADGLLPVTINADGYLKGEYSVATYQTLAYGNEVEWTLEDESLITTVKLTRDYVTVPAEYALGIYYKKLEAKNRTLSAEITPKAAGAVIDMKMKGISEDMNLLAAKVMGEKRVRGVYFNPERTREGRWYETETGSQDIAYVDDDEQVMSGDYEQKSFTLVFGDEVPAWLLTKTKDKTGFELVSRSYLNLHPGERAVVFYDFSKASLQSQFFGSEEDFRVWEFERDRNPYALNPYTEWGASLKSLNKYMAKRQLFNWGNENLANDGSLWKRLFWVEKELKESYFFNDEENGALLYAQDDYTGKIVTPEQVYEGLEKKGYEYKGTVFLPEDTDNAELFVSKDNRTQALLYDFKDGTWRVIFEPFNSDIYDYIVDLIR